MVRAGSGDSASSNNKSCAAVLCLAKTLKFVPSDETVAPSGKLLPGSRRPVPVRPYGKGSLGWCWSNLVGLAVAVAIKPSAHLLAAGHGYDVRSSGFRPS